MKRKDIAIGDLVKTFNNDIGVITKIYNKGFELTTLTDRIKIFCKDIKAVRFIISMCLKHKERNCIICGHNKREQNEEKG